MSREKKNRSGTTVTLLAALVLLFSAGASFAQTTFTINGKLKVEGGDLRGANIVIEKNGHKEKTMAAGNGNFSIPLEFNNQYLLSFEKEGYVTKKLSFDTHAPSEGVEDGFHPFDFTVSLFKQYDDVNIVVFNQPVGIIKYYEEIDDFDYDTDYTKSIRSRLQKALEEVEKAKELEEKSEKLAEKEQKKMESAKAKAELKAKKEEEAKKKAEQEEEERKVKAKAEEEERELASAKTEEDERKKAKERALEEERKRKEALARLAALKQETASGHDGVDSRRETVVNEGFEESPVKKAETLEAIDEPVYAEEIEDEVGRNEELIVEENKVITKITLEAGELATQYQKVVHKFGATFYFKNGQSCSKQIYEQEALADN